MKRQQGYVGHVLIAVTVVCTVALAWLVRDVLIVIFGGLIVATLLRASADGIAKITPLHDKAAVALAVVLILALLVGTGWAIGDQVLSQIQSLREQLPQALDATRDWLQQSNLGGQLLEQWHTAQDDGVPWAKVAGMTGLALGAVANTFLVLALGLYLAVEPDLYRRGLVRLVSPDYRARADQAVVAAATGLRLWLLGQLISMAAIGVLTAIGLYLLGIPLALALGIIAALTAFVPIVGPLSFGVLAVLLAFTEGPAQALYVALLCLGIQQVESYILTPLIQRQTVRLPPALGLIAVFVFGVLFSVPGVLLATPLMVVAMILIEKVYIEYALEGRETEASG